MQIKYLWCAVFLMLAACGGQPSAPVYQGVSYVPPATPGGRMCVDQCNKARDYCQESCGLDYRACYNDVQAAAQRDYDSYVRAHFANPSSLSMVPSSFEHPEACNAQKKSCTADCTRPYDECYRSCGGAVTVTTSCQFLCFE
jgi:hypothetical protein